MLPGQGATRLISYSPGPRKAGYSAHSTHGVEPGCTALQVSTLSRTQIGNTTMGVRLCTRTGLHAWRVGFLMPLRSALHPQAQKIFALSTQHPPQTGRKQQAPRVSQLCPLKDF